MNLCRQILHLWQGCNNEFLQTNFTDEVALIERANLSSARVITPVAMSSAI